MGVAPNKPFPGPIFVSPGDQPGTGEVPQPLDLGILVPKNQTQIRTEHLRTMMNWNITIHLRLSVNMNITYGL